MIASANTGSETGSTAAFAFVEGKNVVQVVIEKRS